MTGEAQPRPPRRFLFAILMLGLTGIFIALGVWQAERLNEKEALIATVAARFGSLPIIFPPVDDWPALDIAAHDYQPLTVVGRFVPGATVLVFTSLTDARGRENGPGYWVMAPFALDKGGTVFVNRGFIPQARVGDVAALAPPDLLTMLIGVGRRPEAAGAFTPAPDTTNRIDWIRDPGRLAALAGIAPPVAPLYLDLPAGPPGTLPQGGETVVEFPNNHLGYALTWFGFALITPILLVFWLRRQRAPAKP